MLTQQNVSVNSDEKTPWRQAQDEFECDHPNTVPRSRVDSSGRTFYIRQCTDCGQQVGTAIKKASIKNLDNVQPFDEEHAQEFERQRWARFDELRRERVETRQADYSAYLSSAAWQAKRFKVLERDNYLCQGCRERRAVEVHHLTYEHIGNELLFELVSVCRQCHETLHPEKVQK